MKSLLLLWNDRNNTSALPYANVRRTWILSTSLSPESYISTCSCHGCVLLPMSLLYVRLNDGCRWRRHTFAGPSLDALLVFLSEINADFYGLSLIYTHRFVKHFYTFRFGFYTKFPLIVVDKYKICLPGALRHDFAWCVDVWHLCLSGSRTRCLQWVAKDLGLLSPFNSYIWLLVVARTPQRPPSGQLAELCTRQLPGVSWWWVGDVYLSVSEDFFGRRGAMGLISLTAARKAVKQMRGRASQSNWLD